MSGQADQPGGTAGHREVDPGDGLDGVGVEHRLVRALGQHRRHGIQVVAHPGLVVGRHYRHQTDPFDTGEHLGQGPEVDPTAGIGRHDDSAGIGHRRQHRRMFHRAARRQATGRPHHAVHGQVVGLGAPAGEHHVTGPGTHQRRHEVPGVVDGPSGGTGHGMGTRRVAGMIGQPRQHRLDHLGSGRRACRMVQVGALHGSEATT